MTAETLQASQLEHRDYVAAVEDYYRRGWTDGLPVIPPEPARVAAFLDAGGVTAREVVGAVPTRDVIVTAEDVAINAVMAGCLPEYAPVALTAVRALLHDEAIPHSVTATLASAAQLIIVNGPVREQIGVECGQGCMGPGFRANATIGRALRLVVRNVLRSIPHELDRGVFSTPNRYSFCFAEDEEGTSWVPLHVERGLRPDQSAVTVASTMGPIIAHPRSHVPELIIELPGTGALPRRLAVGAPAGERRRPAGRARPGAPALLHRGGMVQGRHPAGAVGPDQPAHPGVRRGGPPARPAGGNPARGRRGSRRPGHRRHAAACRTGRDASGASPGSGRPASADQPGR